MFPSGAATFALLKEESKSALKVLLGGGMSEPGGGPGIVFSTIKLLKNFVEAQIAWGELGVPGSTDGTYKIHVGNWVLLVVGTPEVKLNAASKWVTSLRPVAFGIVPSESEVRAWTSNPLTRDPEA